MRLIDADKLKAHYAWWDNEEQRRFDCIVDMQPTVDIETHGKWSVDGDGDLVCSNCGHFTSESLVEFIPLSKAEAELIGNTVASCSVYPHFCSRCGAKMDGGGN